MHAVRAALACSFTVTQQGVNANVLLILLVCLHEEVSRLHRHGCSSFAEELLRKLVYLSLPGTALKKQV